jgi:hypothetical protein
MKPVTDADRRRTCNLDSNREERKMDAAVRLERTLRYLKNAEPNIKHWAVSGDVGRSTEVDGILLNAGSLEHHMVDGLVLAVVLLAKKCAALEREVARTA